MVDDDIEFVRRLIDRQVVSSPVLELGAGYGGRTCRDLVGANGMEYYGTDVRAGAGVDFVADFECADDMEVFGNVAPLGSVLLLNVLEHVFNPIRILDNACKLVRKGGVIVVITPAVWPLHNFPMDAWRILPNFYEEYAKRRKLDLVQKYFEYLGKGPVSAFQEANGAYRFPPPCNASFRYWYSRIVHKAFNTFGRSMFQPGHVSIGAVFIDLKQSR